MPRIKKDDSEERKPIGIRLEQELWRQFKSVAVARGTTATEMMETAMREYLSKPNIKRGK